MKRHPVYLLLGLLLIGTVAAVEWTGWTPSKPSEVKDVPRSIRDNPGSYRPHYIYMGSSYRRGK